MSCGKRTSDSFFDLEDDTFQVKKKYSFFSMETTDSFSKEDPNLSPIVLKTYASEPLMTPDHHSIATRERLPSLKLASSHKKAHRSEHLESSDQLKKKYMVEPSMYADHFKAVKYKDYMYKLDSCLMIRNEADIYNDFICKLVRIIKPTKFDPKGVLAFLEVQWYYKKDELPKKHAQILPHLSASEVFLSTHKDFIMIDCINGPGQILQYNEFDKLETIPNNTYFTRANYDATRKKFDPPIEKWGQNCICRTPMNPDCNYIQCDKCDGWYHLKCVNITTEEATALSQYFCYICRGDKPPSVPSLNLDIKQGTTLKRKKSNAKSHKKSMKEHKVQIKPLRAEEEENEITSQKLQFNITEESDNIFQSAMYNTNNQEPLEYPKVLNLKKETNSVESFGDLFSTTTHHEVTDQCRDGSNQELPDEEEEGSERMDVESVEGMEKQCAEQGFIFEFNLELREDVTNIFSDDYVQEENQDEGQEEEENEGEGVA